MTDIYFEFNDKNAVSQALQYMRKKSLIDWKIRNQRRLRQRTNLNLDSIDGLRISRINNRMNNQVYEQTNGRTKRRLSEIYAGSKQLIYELELVRGTLLIDVKQMKLPKHTTGQKPHGFSITLMVSLLECIRSRWCLLVPNQNKCLSAIGFQEGPALVPE